MDLCTAKQIEQEIAKTQLNLIFREQLTDTVVVITVVVTIGVVVVDEVDDKVVEVVKTLVVVDTKSSLGVIVALGDDAS
jgi:hypothetical protein